MPHFASFIYKLIPLYFIIALGFIAGRYLQVKRESIAPLLLYIVVPIVTFKAIFLQKLSYQILSYPVFMLGISLALSLLFFYIGKKFFDSEHAGLLSLCAGLANVGYFGLPLVLITHGEEALGIVMLLILGTAIHESSFAFLIAARGKYSRREALMKTLRLPAIYTSLLALLCNYLYNHYYLWWDSSSVIKQICDQIIFNTLTSVDKFVGAYTVLGMMMIGLGLSTLERIKFNWKFTGLALVAKYLCYPLFTIVIALINNYYWHFYEPEVMQLLFLMSIVPTGANTISIATELKLPTDTVSITVLISTVFALVYIPLVLYFVNPILH